MNIIRLTPEHRGNNSSIFSGRSEGKDVRERLRIDEYDNDSEQYIVEIPNDTTSFNPSFFLGLFFPSIKKMGSLELFLHKYNITLSNFSDEDARRSINDDLIDCYRRAENEMKFRTGLDL